MLQVWIVTKGNIGSKETPKRAPVNQWDCTRGKKGPWEFRSVQYSTVAHRNFWMNWTGFPRSIFFFTYIYFEKLRNFLPKHNIFLFRTLYYVYANLILFTIYAITLYIIICRIIEVHVTCSHVGIILIDSLNEFC